MRPSSWIGLLAFVVGTSVLACSSSSSDSSTVGGTDGGGTDGATGDGGVKCCPPDSTPGCCMNYGGAAESDGSCVAVCDGMPGPGDPGWKLTKDSSGCSVWENTTPIGSAQVCSGVFDSGVDTGASDASDVDAHDD